MNYEDIPATLYENLPIEAALNRLGFVERSECGLPKRNWGRIEVIAGPWIWEWKLLITIKQNSKSTNYLPQEHSIGRTMRPIDILIIIYCNCDSLFRNEEPPKELMWGKMEWDQYNKEQREEYERRPKVWAEKIFFRFCITYFEKRNDWANEDYDIEFSHADGQLKIKAKDDVVFCPAIGTFNGTLTMSARQLFRHLPKRFVSPTVFIQVLKEHKATISSHMIPNAIWTENPVAEATGISSSVDEASSTKLFGAENTIFTEKKAIKARAVLRKKLSSQNTDIPIKSESEAIDLSTKSTHELVGDVFKIIDEHINLEKKNISSGGVVRDNILKELIPENNDQLNQESKKALKELNQSPDGTALYCLQLAKWSLNNNLEDRDGRLQEMVEEIMPGWNPNKVMKFLTTNLDTGEECDPVDWQMVKNNPEELADQILLTISDQLMLHYLEGYPRHLQPKI